MVRLQKYISLNFKGPSILDIDLTFVWENDVLVAVSGYTELWILTKWSKGIQESITGVRFQIYHYTLGTEIMLGK